MKRNPDSLDIDAPANCTCFNLRKAARAVTQAYDEALRPTGLRATQMQLLAVIAAKGPAGMTELAKTLVMDRTTLTRNLKPLLQQGLLETVEAPDQRQRPIAVTARGRDMLDRAQDHWRQAQARMVEGLGEARWSRLLRDLDESVRLLQSS